WTEILQRIAPIFDVGRFLDQRSGDLRIGRCLRELQKRRNLTRNILTAYQSISPVSYAPLPKDAAVRKSFRRRFKNIHKDLVPGVGTNTAELASKRANPLP